MATSAVAAWRRFGKGRHPAALNLGDCFSYALTHSCGGALLFKGKDFSQTDVRSALPQVDPVVVRQEIDAVLDPRM